MMLGARRRRALKALSSNPSTTESKPSGSNASNNDKAKHLREPDRSPSLREADAGAKALQVILADIVSLKPVWAT